MRKNTSICQYLEESPLETIRYRYMAAYLIYKQTKKSDKLMFHLNKYISQAEGLGLGHWALGWRMSDCVDNCLGCGAQGAAHSSEHKQNYLTEIFV